MFFAPSSRLAKRLRPAAARSSTPTRMELLRLFAMLIVGQGALRKWFLPGLSTTLYVAKDVALLVPSRYEPFGIVALEALSCGCPVVAARTGGLPEAVGAGGLLCTPDDAGDLARQIRRARTPAVRDRLREAAPAHLARHDIDHIAGRYLEVLKAAVGGE